jgi:hypothetical protein
MTWLSMDSGRSQKEWEVENTCGFQEAQCDNKERSLSIAFY